MKIKFKDEHFTDAALALVQATNTIVSQYESRLTARQVYYQFVSHVPGFQNSDANYKKVTDIISKGRMAGLIDWDAIEDRGRVISMPTEFSGIGAGLQLLHDQYKVKRWEDQPRYAELWVEKQALAGVLQPIADKVHVPFMANKGYGSSSSMFEASRRLIHYGAAKEEAIIFYLGDFDPSGEDMVRDIRDRLTTFGVQNLRVVKLALTWEQIQTYNPPPNPAKITDPRARAFIEEHGDESWEVNALDPTVIETIIMDAFKGIVDVKLMKAAKKREKEEKKYLLSLIPETT